MLTTRVHPDSIVGHRAKEMGVELYEALELAMRTPADPRWVEQAHFALDLVEGRWKDAIRHHYFTHNRDDEPDGERAVQVYEQICREDGEPSTIRDFMLRLGATFARLRPARVIDHQDET